MDYVSEVRLVAVLAAEGSIHKASDVLGLSQPALTKKLQRLETRLKMNLFERSRAGAKLTKDGQYFLEKGLPLAKHAQELDQALALYRDGHHEVIRIGIVSGAGQPIVREALLSFFNEFPKATIIVEIGDTLKLCEDLKAGRLDMAITLKGYEDLSGHDPVLDDDFIFTSIARLPMSVAVHNKHPILNEKSIYPHILSYPLISIKVPTAGINLYRRTAQKYKIKFEGPRILVDDFDLIFEYLLDTHYWTMVFDEVIDTLGDVKDKMVFFSEKRIIPDMHVGCVIKKNTIRNRPILSMLEKIENAAHKIESRRKKSRG